MSKLEIKLGVALLVGMAICIMCMVIGVAI